MKDREPTDAMSASSCFAVSNFSALLKLQRNERANSGWRRHVRKTDTALLARTLVALEWANLILRGCTTPPQFLILGKLLRSDTPEWPQSM